MVKGCMWFRECRHGSSHKTTRTRTCTHTRTRKSTRKRCG